MFTRRFPSTALAGSPLAAEWALRLHRGEWRCCGLPPQSSHGFPSFVGADRLPCSDLSPSRKGPKLEASFFPWLAWATLATEARHFNLCFFFWGHGPPNSLFSSHSDDLPTKWQWTNVCCSYRGKLSLMSEYQRQPANCKPRRSQEDRRPTRAKWEMPSVQRSASSCIWAQARHLLSPPPLLTTTKHGSAAWTFVINAGPAGSGGLSTGVLLGRFLTSVATLPRAGGPYQAGRLKAYLQSASSSEPVSSLYLVFRSGGIPAFSIPLRHAPGEVPAFPRRLLAMDYPA